MENNNESFRNEFISRITGLLSEEQIIEVLKGFDMVVQNYVLSKQTTDIITTDVMPTAVGEYLASKMIGNKSKLTVRQYYYKLLNFFIIVRKPLKQITTNDIRLYLYNFKESRNASDRYVESVRVTLNSFFRWCSINDYVDRNPMEKIEPTKYQAKQRDALTPLELEKLRYGSKNIREKAVIDFLFSTGVRVSECAEVKLSDIDWKDRCVNIRHGKGDKQRFVYFNSESEVSLKKYLETRDDSTDALFVSNRSPYEPIKSHALENIIKVVSKRTGIPATPHKLRHTFATYAISCGMPLEKLQKLLGHSKPETTMIYAQQYQEELKMEHRRVYA